MLVVTEHEQLPVGEARAGSSEAWDVLFKRYQLPLYVYVFELVRDEQTSLDVVQETFVAAVRHLGGLRDDCRFGSWIFGIAHQKCVQRWRKRTRDQMLRDELAEMPEELESGPDDLLIAQEREGKFMELLNQLPLPQRSALLLHFIEEFSLEEISNISGVSVGTVKSRIHYARKALKNLWEQNNENTA